MSYDKEDNEIGICTVCYKKSFNLTPCRTFKHSVCKKCFNNLIKYNATVYNTFKCPICSRLYPIITNKS